MNLQPGKYEIIVSYNGSDQPGKYEIMVSYNGSDQPPNHPINRTPTLPRVTTHRGELVFTNMCYGVWYELRNPKHSIPDLGTPDEPLIEYFKTPNIFRLLYL